VTFPVTPTEFKLHVATSLGDPALQTKLDAAYAAILLHAGPYMVVSGADDQVDAIITPRGPGILLRLPKRAASIEEVIEGETTLAADDYQLRSSGLILRRLDTGTNPATYWRRRVYVQFTPLSDMAIREMVQIQLVELDINFTPGLSSEKIGDWSETANTAFGSIEEQRAAILAQLNPPAGGVW